MGLRKVRNTLKTVLQRCNNRIAQNAQYRELYKFLSTVLPLKTETTNLSNTHTKVQQFQENF